MQDSTTSRRGLGDAMPAPAPRFSKSPFEFIPQFSEAMPLLDINRGLTGVINAMFKAKGITSPVDPKTLRRYMTHSYQALRPSSIKKINQSIREALPFEIDDQEVEQLCSPWANLGIPSNGISWFLAVLVPVQRMAPEQMQMRSIRFLRNRINQEFLLMSQLKQQGGGLHTGAPAVKDIWDAFVRERTLISPLQLNNSLDIILAADHRSAPGRSVTLAAHRLALYLKVDFYYSLVACYELDLCPGIQDEELENFDIFGGLVPHHAEGQYQEPIELVFDKWRTTFSSDPLKPLTWIEMAGNIRPSFGVPPERRGEFSRPEDARQFMREITKARLYDWRKGKKRPQKDQMDAFVKSLIPAGMNDWWACLRLYWANALGRLIESEKKHNESSPLPLQEIEITSAFCDFEKYRSRFAVENFDEELNYESGPADHLPATMD